MVAPTSPCRSGRRCCRRRGTEVRGLRRRSQAEAATRDEEGPGVGESWASSGQDATTMPTVVASGQGNARASFVGASETRTCTTDRIVSGLRPRGEAHAPFALRVRRRSLIGKGSEETPGSSFEAKQQPLPGERSRHPRAPLSAGGAAAAPATNATGAVETSSNTRWLCGGARSARYSAVRPVTDRPRRWHVMRQKASPMRYPLHRYPEMSRLRVSPRRS